MNLFVELLSEYLMNQCDDVLGAANSQASKITLVVQSIPIRETAATIQRLDTYFTTTRPGTKREIRISLGQWNSWNASDRLVVTSAENFEQNWVDSHDQLTIYRNQCHCIFFGFDHASDKGSLKDFHVVDENLLWSRALGGDFRPWIARIAEEINDEDVTAEEALMGFLEAVHKFNSFSLVRISRFFEKLIDRDPASLKDFVRLCNASLSEWGGLPLPGLSIGRNVSKVRRLIDLSHRFSTHAIFVSLADRNRALRKLNLAEVGEHPYALFELPSPVVEGDSSYKSASDYLDDVKVFISTNDPQALFRLRGWDAQPLLELLEKREKKKTGSAKAILLRGYSDVVFLQAVLIALKKFIEEYGQAAAIESAQKVVISLERYVADSEEPHEELQQLLGGIFGNCIPEELVLELDSTKISISVQFDGLGSLVTSSTNGIARLEFSIGIISSADTESFLEQFSWALPATHPERVRLVLAKQALNEISLLSAPRLPSFRIGGFDEMFYATDEEDSNRLLQLGIAQFSAVNVLNELPLTFIDPGLVAECSKLTSGYREFLERFVNLGFYTANSEIHRVITEYGALVDTVIGQQKLGAEHVLPRLYRTFLALRINDVSSNEYVGAAILLPISPFVLELSLARAVFLRDGFQEVAEELFRTGPSAAQSRWDRLVGLVELRRPIVGLVCDANKSLTTKTRSFGLMHLLGNPDDAQLSVASQSLMREKGFDEDDLGERLRPTAASRMYMRLIRDYQTLHRHSDDQLNLLFVNVLEIETLLSGVDRWLKEYLYGTSDQQSPFVLNVKIITTGVAVTTALNILVAWRNQWAESDFSDLRRCSIQIGHRHAQTIGELNSMLKLERNLRFDLAVIAHFLEGQHDGDHLERTAPFNTVEGLKLRQFPIAEYARPAMSSSAGNYRRTLISNRRIRMASKHTEIAARLRDPQADINQEYVVLAQVDFVPWQPTIALLHEKALWVSCIDRYVDRSLLTSAEMGQQHLNRRVVGFSCGLGDYGELNQTVSTEANDLASLTKTVAFRLRGYLNSLTTENAELAAHNVIETAAEIPGLSLVRAAGHDEYVRDVIGYSLIGRLLGREKEALLQVLIPLDSFRHWFSDRDDSNIPDLLSLTASLVGGRLKIKAVVIECKFAQENLQHSEKAFAQASSGLRQLSRIFAPDGSPIKVVVFERKYWWAQLHRALTSRTTVTLSQSEYDKLCNALERLGEGQFDISWKSVACTFWVNKNEVDHHPSFMGSVDVGASVPLPNNFGVYQMQFGADDVIQLLTEKNIQKFSAPGESLDFSSSVTSEDQIDISKEDHSIQNVGNSLEGPSTEAGSSAPASFQTGKQTATSSPSKEAIKAESSDPVISKMGSFSSTTTAPRILLGVDSKGQSVFWEYGDSELENRHLLIFGSSGSGKTYAIQGILLELAKHGQHAAIIDYTDGFLPSHLDPIFAKQVRPLTHVLINVPFPINPFQRLSKDEPGIGSIQEKPHNVASRVSDIFCSVYNVGDVQRGALAKYIERGLVEHDTFSFEDLLGVLDAAADVPPNLALKIAEFVRQTPFSVGKDSGWGGIYSGSSRIQILQLTALSKDIQRLIAEFSLWDLFAYATRHGSKTNQLPIVLDEVQNLDHRTDRALDKLLREGRKFGVGLILATQTIANFDKEQRSRLFQAGQKLFFKPAETERREFAQILADVSPNRSRDEWVTELSKLGKGECWSIGPRRISDSGLVKREPIKVKIASIESRIVE